MYISIRQYKTNQAKEFTKRVNESWVPLISKVSGFIAYYAVETADGWASVSIFKDKAGAEESNRMAPEWIKQHAAGLVVGPEITAGEAVIHKTV